MIELIYTGVLAEKKECLYFSQYMIDKYLISFTNAFNYVVI